MIMASTIAITSNDCHYRKDNSTDWHYSCEEGFWFLNDYIFFAMSVTAHLLMLFLSRRDGSKRSLCRGHPGIIFPLNMLDGYENRLAYCAAFGSMTFELTSILYSPYGRFTTFAIGHAVKDDPIIRSAPVARFFLLLAQVVIITFLFYPFFLCLSSRHKLTGAITGVVLSAYKFCVFIWTSTCKNTELDILSANFIFFLLFCFFQKCMIVLVLSLFIGIWLQKVKTYFLAILLWPCIICSGILLLQYITIIAWCVRNRTYGEYMMPEPIALPHHLVHVKYLLGKDPLPWSEKKFSNVSMFNKEKFLAHFGFRHIPGFKFPTRVLATFCVTVLTVYQIGVQVGFQVYSLLKVVRRVVRCEAEIPKTRLPGLVQIILKGRAEFILKYANYAVHIWIVTLIFTCLLAVLYVYHMCLCYRKHTLRIYRGDRSLFPSQWVRQANHTILSCASNQAGLQIVYTIWGFVLIQMMLYLIACFLVFIIWVPPYEFGIWGIIINLLQLIIAPVVLYTVIYLFHVILNRFFFLQPKINPKDDKLPLSIDNRKAWYNVSFFFFFWNLFFGLFYALTRVLKGLFLGILFIPRIERPVLMRGFETWDDGFNAYLSLLTVINAHDHPVVKVAVKLLMDRFQDNQIKNQPGENFTMSGVHPSVEKGHSRKKNQRNTRNTASGTKRARYYWFLAYTLIHNPDLLSYRKVRTIPEDKIARITGKHKISLAIHRKSQGEATSKLYNTDAVI